MPLAGLRPDSRISQARASSSRSHLHPVLLVFPGRVGPLFKVLAAVGVYASVWPPWGEPSRGREKSCGYVHSDPARRPRISNAVEGTFTLSVIDEHPQEVWFEEIPGGGSRDEWQRATSYDRSVQGIRDVRRAVVHNLVRNRRFQGRSPLKLSRFWRNEYSARGRSRHVRALVVPQRESSFGDLGQALYRAAASRLAWESEGGSGVPKGTSSQHAKARQAASEREILSLSRLSQVFRRRTHADLKAEDITAWIVQQNELRARPPNEVQLYIRRARQVASRPVRVDRP